MSKPVSHQWDGKEEADGRGSVSAASYDLGMAYESARDLPSYLELERQLKVVRFLGRSNRKLADAIRLQLREFGDTVDAFYDLFGGKHWIFHDQLPLESVRAIVANAGEDVDGAERKLIELYHDAESLPFMILPLRKLPAMRRRLTLVERARQDYFAGRYYATVQVLLSVMDGFVNEFESVRRGLHARAPEELQAWDSVVGHHRGLQHAHKTFLKGRTATLEEPVYELYRNGIVHGSILNYDNLTVATKAWNRLFAVADWAAARLKEQEHQSKEPATLSSVGRQLKELTSTALRQAEINRVNEKWNPCRHLPGSETFNSHPTHTHTRELLNCWMRRNYGSLSDLLTHDLHTRHGKAVRSEVRRAYDPFVLSAFEILSIHHDMAAACTVTATLDHGSSATTEVELRWVREDAQSYPTPEPWPGNWRLVTWDPRCYLGRIAPSSSR